MKRQPNSEAKGPDRGGSWAILGGVFDPIHNGHLTLAEDFLATGRFDGILFVPSFEPPHKAALENAPFDDRVAMLRMALRGRPQFVISTIEAEMDEPGYTLNVVRRLKKRFPQARFSFIMGADNIGNMKNWHQPEKIFEEVPVIAGARPGYDPADIETSFGRRVEFVATRRTDVSGTDIRRRLSQGMSREELAGFVPEAVAAYIFERKLYQ